MAARLWSDASAELFNHPYLAKKGVGAHGLRQQSDGCLIVPLCDENGGLHSLQTMPQPERSATCRAVANAAVFT